MISANFRDFSQQEFNASDFNWLHEGIVFCKVNVTTHQSFILKQLALQIITAKFKWNQMMPSFDAFLKSAIKPMLRTCPLSCFRMEYWKIWRVNIHDIYTLECISRPYCYQVQKKKKPEKFQDRTSLSEKHPD